MSTQAKIEPKEHLAIRSDFPLLSRKVNGKPLIYFDNGATAQKPKVVIDALAHYYSDSNSNIHRGVHRLSQDATSAYEEARKKIQAFIGAEHSEEIIFTKGTTDGINTLAFSFGLNQIKAGDEIIISAMEHHSNIVPWQMLCERTGGKLLVAPIHKSGELDLQAFEDLLSEKTKLVSIVHTSNTLGTINPVDQIIEMSHRVGAKVILDGAQAIAHQKIDVREIDCDFFVFSMHKVYGPTGIGILYGKKELLDELPPYQGGGDMIETVSFEKSTYNVLPHKFEAGTPNIAAGIASGVCIDYLNQLDWEKISLYEQDLLNYASEKLKLVPGLRIIGEAKQKASVISFIIDGIHPYDIGIILDQFGIAVRTGHHCTQPLMDWYKIPGTVRASFAMYNTKEEVEVFLEALHKAIKMLKP